MYTKPHHLASYILEMHDNKPKHALVTLNEMLNIAHGNMVIKEAIKLFLFLNDIDYSNFAKNLNISRTWLHNVFDTEIQTPKTWETIKKFTNVNKQDMLSLYFRCYYEQNTLQMLNKSELTIEKLNKIVDKSGPVIIY